MNSDRGLPRVVLITRRTALDHLIERFGTFGQAEFYLRSRGHGMDDCVRQHELLKAAVTSIQQNIQPEQRRVRVDRSELDSFLFADDDVVVIVGQDGLVANVAKYLQGQPVIGVNPDPSRYDGILCPHRAEILGAALDWAANPSATEFRLQRRVLAQAVREDGQRLLGLNEVFVGHRTHQSARYELHVDDHKERQSSSGLVCATGTGSTGWARSIAEQRGIHELPQPELDALAWFVREPFPSVATGTDLDHGVLHGGDQLTVCSSMETGGVVFADGIETDALEFVDGQTVTISVAPERLHVVVAAQPVAAGASS